MENLVQSKTLISIFKYFSKAFTVCVNILNRFSNICIYDFYDFRFILMHVKDEISLKIVK